MSLFHPPKLKVYIATELKVIIPIILVKVYDGLAVNLQRVCSQDSLVRVDAWKEGLFLI